MSKMPPENFQSALQLRQTFSQGPDFHGGRCAENSTNRATRVHHRRKRRVYEIVWSLREPLDDLSQAEWNVRVGDYRVLYCAVGPTVQVLRVILKGTATLEEALARSMKS